MTVEMSTNYYYIYSAILRFQTECFSYAQSCIMHVSINSCGLWSAFIIK